MYRESVQLSLAKIQQMETMIQKFMTFAKLPDTRLEDQQLSNVLKSFVEHYSDSLKEKLLFAPIPSLTKEPCLKLDEGLLHNAFFALCQNALEALPDTEQAQIRFQLIQIGRHVQLIFSNTGTLIPDVIRENLFTIGSSSKLNSQKNFGIGLAMAKKIMLDHGGDLILSENSHEKGVSFLFTFPSPEELQ